jgi:uncharacterized protein YndB with AHSA1/START domain
VLALANVDPLVGPTGDQVPGSRPDDDVPHRNRVNAGASKEAGDRAATGFERPVEAIDPPTREPGQPRERNSEEGHRKGPERGRNAPNQATDYNAAVTSTAEATPSTPTIFRSFREPLSEVWVYLSRPDLLARWLGRIELELTPDGTFQAELWNGDKASGRVIAVAPPVRLDLSWRSASLSPETRVSFRLEGDGPGSRLTIRHDALGSESERVAALATWRDALQALRATLRGGADCHEWGAEIPVAARAAIPRSAADLWPLLSTGTGIEKWVAHVERFDAAPGGAFRLTSRFQGRDVVEEGLIEELVPESRIALSWEWLGEGWGAPTRVEFSIEDTGSGSSVLVVHSGFDRIATEQRLLARRNYAAAWPEVLAYLRRLVAPVAP